jgi:hypothetical protein
MKTRKFDEWEINESNKDFSTDGIIKIVNKIPFFMHNLNWMFTISTNSDYIQKEAIVGRFRIKGIRIISNITSIIPELEKNTECHIIPSLLKRVSLYRIEFIKDDSLPLNQKKDELEAKLDTFVDSHILTINYNAENYKQLEEVIRNSVEILFDEFRDVRIVLPHQLRKVEGLNDAVKLYIRSVYNKMLDEFYENNKLDPDDYIFNENTMLKLMGDIIDENPSLIPMINNIDPDTKEKWFKLMGGNKIEIDKDFSSIIKNYMKILKVLETV